MSHICPSAIFSPSLARQQAASAKDWSYIDSWLSQKFSGTYPSFERNPETLKALLALAFLNESADEDSDLLSAVEKKAVAEYEAGASSGPDDIDVVLDFIEGNLNKEGEAALSALAEASTLLSLPTFSISTLSTRLLDLQTNIFDLTQTHDRVSALQSHLERELASTNKLVEELRSERYQAPPGLAKQTVEYQRKTKVLVAKIPLLRDRLTALTTSSASGGIYKPSVQDIQALEGKYTQQAVVTKGLEDKVKSFHGLPHDVDLARLELETLRVELTELLKERDELFEGLVERESPKKPVAKAVKRG